MGVLPHSIDLCIGKPYMNTANIDINDELLNGTVGTLMHMGRNSNEDNEIEQLWEKFPVATIGQIGSTKSSVFYATTSRVTWEWTALTKISATTTFFQVLQSFV